MNAHNKMTEENGIYAKLDGEKEHSSSSQNSDIKRERQKNERTSKFELSSHKSHQNNTWKRKRFKRQPNTVWEGKKWMHTMAMTTKLRNGISNANMEKANEQNKNEAIPCVWLRNISPFAATAAHIMCRKHKSGHLCPASSHFIFHFFSFSIVYSSFCTNFFESFWRFYSL